MKKMLMLSAIFALTSLVAGDLVPPASGQGVDGRPRRERKARTCAVVDAASGMVCGLPVAMTCQVCHGNRCKPVITCQDCQATNCALQCQKNHITPMPTRREFEPGKSPEGEVSSGAYPVGDGGEAVVADVPMAVTNPGLPPFS